MRLSIAPWGDPFVTFLQEYGTRGISLDTNSDL